MGGKKVGEIFTIEASMNLWVSSGGKKMECQFMVLADSFLFLDRKTSPVKVSHKSSCRSFCGWHFVSEMFHPFHPSLS